jgi:hypothetical protein
MSKVKEGVNVNDWWVREHCQHIQEMEEKLEKA